MLTLALKETVMCKISSKNIFFTKAESAVLRHKEPFSAACTWKRDQCRQYCWYRNFVYLKICLTNYFW